MVEWLALRAGSRLLLMPKAEAMELAPKQSAEADDPLASRSEGFLFVTEIALVKRNWASPTRRSLGDSVLVWQRLPTQRIGRSA